MYKRLMLITFLAAALLGVCLIVFALPGKQATEGNNEAAIPDNPLNASAAETTYKSNCVSCHGVDLEGKIGPNLSHIGTQLSKEQIYNKIMKGGGVMPSFKEKLSAEEASNLAKWLSDKT